MIGLIGYISNKPDRQIKLYIGFMCAIDSSMATDKPKILLILDNEMLERIEDFRFSNRIPSRAEAIRRLIDEGLKHIQKKPADKSK